MKMEIDKKKHIEDYIKMSQGAYVSAKECCYVEGMFLECSWVNRDGKSMISNVQGASLESLEFARGGPVVL